MFKLFRMGFLWNIKLIIIIWMETEEEYTEEYPFTIIIPEDVKQGFSKLNNLQMNMLCDIFAENINEVIFKINQNEK